MSWNFESKGHNVKKVKVNVLQVILPIFCHDWINDWNRLSVQLFWNYLIKFEKHNLPGLIYDIIIKFCLYNV